MKKKYYKPAIAMESFVLSQTIASCGAKHEQYSHPLQSEKAVCAWNYNGYVIFTETVQACTDYTTEKFDDICYNNPEGGQSIFNS